MLTSNCGHRVFECAVYWCVGVVRSNRKLPGSFRLMWGKGAADRVKIIRDGSTDWVCANAQVAFDLIAGRAT